MQGTGKPVRERSRAGAGALSLLAAPLNGLILRALAAGPLRLADLRREVGLPAATTLRERVARLEEAGAIAKRGPRATVYELTAGGEGLLFVIEALERWLALAPGAPMELGGEPAKVAVRALADGWQAGILRALAARPSTWTELDGLIGELSYPALGRRLAAMEAVGQVEALPAREEGKPYAVGEWTRRGVAPLAAAARCERAHMVARARPVGRIDVEAGFLLAVPLIDLAEGLDGDCALAVEAGGEQLPVGVRVDVERGRIASCVARLEPDRSASVLGGVGAWLDAVIEGRADGLQLGGDRRLAAALAEGLHTALFGGYTPEGRGQASSSV